MRDINWYAETAKSKNNFKSGNQLAKKMGISGPSFHRLTTGQSFPSDETMIKLAQLAGIEPVMALSDLNMMRASSPKVLSVYQKMDKLLSRAAVLTVTLIVLTLGSNGANASKLLTQKSIAQHNMEYILSHFFNYVLIRLLRPINSFLNLLCFHNQCFVCVKAR